MQVLLQNCKTREFYVSPEKWTKEPMQALNFKSSLRALEFCFQTRPADVQIVLKFDSNAYDLTFAVSDNCGPLEETKTVGRFARA